MEMLSGFSAVTVRTTQGDLITKENLERMGPDGGMDLIIEIETKSEANCRQIAGKVRRVIEQM